MEQQGGLLHLYCGDGKGKTTTSVGLMVRAAGSGKKVLFYQFMKNNESSERNILEGIPNITCKKGADTAKFWRWSTRDERKLRSVCYTLRDSAGSGSKGEPDRRAGR